MLLPLALLLMAPAPELATLISRVSEAEKLAEGQRRPYVFTELQTVWEADKQGMVKPGTKPSTRKYEVIFLEGEQFRRLVERNGKPLSARENQKIAETMRRTAAERREARKRGVLIKTTFRISPGSFYELPELMDFRYLGEERVDERPAFLLEAKPKPGLRPADAKQKEMLNYENRFWVDQQDFYVLRRRTLTITPAGDSEPGTEFTLDYSRGADGVVLPRGLVLNFIVKPIPFVTDRGRKEYQFFDYKKFDVESTITYEEK